MLARRIIAVSPDKAFGKQLVIALKAAGGAVDLHASLEALGTGELQAALVVLHLDGELAAAGPTIVGRLTSDTRVIAILPRTNLAAVVDIMQSSDRVSGMMVAEELDSRLLSAMAARVLNGDIFGLDKLILWGTQIHSHLVGDYQEKSLCIGQISEFAELMGVRRKYRESIEQCVDEMLMNALYDAPVDEQGKQIFSDIPTKTRISLRVEQKVVVQYACDGKQFAVSVRDAFGTLERSTVLRYLHKCLHNEQQIDRKAGGAGLGLYLMTNSSSQVYFNVLPGVATEAVCVFDLETPKLQLESFGFFHEKIDAAGRLASGPSRRLPATGPSFPVERRRGDRAPGTPRGLVAVLAGLITVCVVLIGIAAYPRLTGGSQRHLTKVTVHTSPPGAVVEIEGKNAGTAKDGTLVISDLEVGRAYPLVARLDGYVPRQAVVQPTKDGGEVTVSLEALAATVTLDSTPQGADVEVDGAALGTTPGVDHEAGAGQERRDHIQEGRLPDGHREARRARARQGDADHPAAGGLRRPRACPPRLRAPGSPGRAERATARRRDHARRGPRRGRQARAVHADHAAQGAREPRAVHPRTRRRQHHAHRQARRWRHAVGDVEPRRHREDRERAPVQRPRAGELPGWPRHLHGRGGRTRRARDPEGFGEGGRSSSRSTSAPSRRPPARPWRSAARRQRRRSSRSARATSRSSTRTARPATRSR